MSLSCLIGDVRFTYRVLSRYCLAIMKRFQLSPTIIGEGGLDWPAVAAGATLFMIPVVFFTILLRKNLLRGITFGALRK